MLGPSGKGVYGTHNAERQHHVHTAGVCGTEHLKAPQAYQGGGECCLCIASFGVVDIHPHHHQQGGQCARKTCSPFAHAAQHSGGGGNAPVEEWWFVSHFATVVMWQYPVVLLNHGQRHDGFAWFSLGVKVGKSQPR